MAIVLPTKRLGRNLLYLILDIALAFVFCIELEERFTGLQLHELIGVGLGVALIVHLLIHWRWMLSITRTFIHKLIHESRLNYLLALALLIDFVVIIVTGLGISRTLGLNFSVGRDWEQIHRAAADLSLLLVAGHVALHWKWIASHVKRYFFSFKLPVRSTPALPVQPSVQPSSEV